MSEHTWQPIETAPKDGTRIIVNSNWVGHDDRPLGAEITRWTDEWGWHSLELNPTHWMPLPDPPKDAEATT